MAADSPTTERDVFNYDRSSTPPPTTSSYMPRHEPALKIDKDKGPDEEGKEDKEPKDEKDKDKDEKDHKDGPLGPGANPGYKKEDEAIVRADGGKKDGGDDKGHHNEKKMNGVDGLDGKWIPPPPKDDEGEDQCVKCLYYAMQCCECTIS